VHQGEQGSTTQLSCAHCYHRLPSQRRQKREILCTPCESAWIKKIQPDWQRHLQAILETPD
jgi:DNA-directed RNA polymerase subunit RPC12/RpoP